MGRLSAIALSEARKHGHHWVGVEHLLLALTREPPGTPAADALAACGVTEADAAAVLAAIEIPPQPYDRQNSISPNPAYYKVEARAEGFALSQGISEPLPEHVLLAIIWQQGSIQRLKNPAATPAALQVALAQTGVPVPPLEPPLPTEFGEAVDVSATELPIFLGRLHPLLSPPEITVAVRREGDRASVRAHPTIDLTGQLQLLRSKT